MFDFESGTSNDTQHNDTSMTLSIMTLSIMTLNTKGLFVTVSINDTEHIRQSASA